MFYRRTGIKRTGAPVAQVVELDKERNTVKRTIVASSTFVTVQVKYCHGPVLFLRDCPAPEGGTTEESSPHH